MAPPCTNKEDKTNYAHSHRQLKVLFIHKGVWELVQGFERKPSALRNLKMDWGSGGCIPERATRLGRNEIGRPSLFDQDIFGCPHLDKCSQSVEDLYAPELVI